MGRIIVFKVYAWLSPEGILFKDPENVRLTLADVVQKHLSTCTLDEDEIQKLKRHDARITSIGFPTVEYLDTFFRNSNPIQIDKGKKVDNSRTVSKPAKVSSSGKRKSYGPSSGSPDSQ